MIIGNTDGLQAHSFDSRGVYRVVETSISDEAWEYSMPREQPSDIAFAEGTPVSRDACSCRMTTRPGKTRPGKTDLARRLQTKRMIA